MTDKNMNQLIKKTKNIVLKNIEITTYWMTSITRNSVHEFNWV